MFLLTDYDYVRSLTEASHRYGNLPTGDPSTTENSAYSFREDMVAADDVSYCTYGVKPEWLYCT